MSQTDFEEIIEGLKKLTVSDRIGGRLLGKIVDYINQYVDQIAPEEEKELLEALIEKITKESELREHNAWDAVYDLSRLRNSTEREFF